MIRKVVLFDDSNKIHCNFCDELEHGKPNGTSPEDRRAFPIFSVDFVIFHFVALNPGQTTFSVSRFR